MGSGEPMSEKRLAEIMSLTADVVAGRIHVRFDEETAWLAILDMRREVERLRAHEAALMGMLAKLISDADATYVDVHPYAGVGHTKIIGSFPASLEQARALLASAAQEGGGDGQR